jgi:hypothetical protein
MPNWCDTEVKITFGNETDYKNFLTQADATDNIDHVYSDKYEMFDKFITTPADLLAGEGWWQWRIDNWGTKWNPSVRDFERLDTENKVVLSLDTAWAPPIEFFDKFSQLYPTANIQIIYYEPGMNFCGRAVIQNGKVSDRYINDISPDMQVAAGAVLDENGNIDWDHSDMCMWDLIADEEKFNNYYEMESA